MEKEASARGSGEHLTFSMLSTTLDTLPIRSVAYSLPTLYSDTLADSTVAGQGIALTTCSLGISSLYGHIAPIADNAHPFEMKLLK